MLFTKTWRKLYHSEIMSHDQPREEYEPLLVQQIFLFNYCNDKDLKIESVKKDLIERSKMASLDQ